MRPLLEVSLDEQGRQHVCWNFSAGQKRAIESMKRFVLVQAGWQSGKTVIGGPWLHREIKRCGPGDYLVASPTYPLMMKKVLPEFLRLFKRILRLGEFVGQRNIFTFSPDGCEATFGYVPDDPVQIFFGHAGDPDSLESATIKAAWADEAGQKGFRLASYEAIIGRLSIHQGRLLITSRPYDLGWMKQQLYDPWMEVGKNHPDIDVINFRSIDNPAFPPEEYERAKREMPGWRFRMKYDGLFERPAGLIYDSFDPLRHKIKRFTLPEHWPRFLGLDFGGTNTAGLFFAAELDHNKKPTRRLYCYREYRGGKNKAGENLTAAEHIVQLMKGEVRIPYCVGGAGSEGHWRAEFSKGGIVPDASVHGGWRRVHGLPVHAPSVKEVDVGIARVYSAFRRDEILVFDDLPGFLDELESYSYEVDEQGEPIPDKIDSKSEFHLCDAARYLMSYLKRDAAGAPQQRGGTIKPGLNLNAPMNR